MEQETKQLMAEHQLKNIAKLLNGRIIRRVCKNSSGETWRSVTVEFIDASGIDGE